MEFLHRIIDIFTGFNVLSVTVRLLLALIMGGLIGMERGRHGRAAGMRTHILVCVGSCMTALVGIYIMSINPGENITRIAAQVISGIGFLGAGTIMIRNQSIITGLTTAAGVWCTATIGIALGYGFYLGAYIAMMLTCYQLAAFDAGCGSHQKLWFWGLVSVYLCAVSLSGNQEPLILLLCMIWILPSLRRPAPAGAAPAPEEA